MSRRAERDHLVTIFETIRGKFFPRWDKARAWRVRVNRRMLGDGLCCQATKTIYINPRAENQIGTLIHEVCHALTPRVNHGATWQGRILKAAVSAERFRELSLAEFLRSEVIKYRHDAETVTVRAIYMEIEQAVEECAAIPSFGSIVRLLAHNNLMNPREFVARFRGAKEAYKRAVARRASWNRTRAILPIIKNVV